MNPATWRRWIQHLRALAQLRALHDVLDVPLHVLGRPAARMRDVRELREVEAELGKEAKHLARHALHVVLAAGDDEARDLATFSGSIS